MHTDIAEDHATAPPDSRPTLRELEVLHAMITTGKTTAAAHKLSISQPAISRALASLEERLGQPLFQREGGRLIPTTRALALNAQAGAVFDALERLAAWPDMAKGDNLLKIVTPPTLGEWFLVGMIERYRAQNPQTRIHVEIGKTPDVIAMIADGAADIGFTDGPITQPGIATTVFRRAHAHVILPAGHRLAQQDSLTPPDLAGEPIIALTRRFPTRALCDAAFRDHGIEPRIAIEASTSSIAAGLVHAGAGITLLNPFPLTLRADPRLVFVPFRPRISYETAMLFPQSAQHNLAARHFGDFVRRNQPEDGLSEPLRPSQL
jgi:DNA-binding transcriptional LysR family regulator